MEDIEKDWKRVTRSGRVVQRESVEGGGRIIVRKWIKTEEERGIKLRHYRVGVEWINREESFIKFWEANLQENRNLFGEGQPLYLINISLNMTQCRTFQLLC